MRVNKKVIIFAINMLVCAMLFGPKLVFAGASISLTGGTWALGAKPASSETTSAANAWTVTNDSTGGTEDVLIKVTSTLSWTASTDGTQTANKFVLRKDNNAGQIITGTDGTLVTGLTNNGTNSFGLYFKAPPTGSEEGAHTLTVTLTATNWVIVCGESFTVAHTAGAVAPVDKTVTYGTVSTTLGGTGAKCWIIQNLGAATSAALATESTEPNAGWYWQFNRQQGFMHDGTTRTPATAWDTSNDNTYTGWDPAKDPCILLLGAGWRLPTDTEWTNADATGAWSNKDNTYASVLKLHNAGSLLSTDGSLSFRGSVGNYWSSVQGSVSNGWMLYFNNVSSLVSGYAKANAYSVRCLKD